MNIQSGSPKDPATTDASTSAGGVRIRVFGRTDVGRVRDHNEDNFLVADLSQNARGLTENIRQHTVGAHGTLLAVCDGMGGAAAGEVASKLAVDIIHEQMQAGGAPSSRDEIARRLVRAVEVAGLRIFAEAKLDRNRRGMGTTATAAALIDDHLFFAQVGDSRGYILRGDQLVQVTRDQSLVNQLIESGQLTPEEAENFEHSNIILQALGTQDSVQVDLTVVVLREGDTLLMCSDGLSGMVRADEIRQVLLQCPEPVEACRQLTDRANDQGGQDNITVIVAKFGAVPPPSSNDAPLKYTKYAFQVGDDGLGAPTPASGVPSRPPVGAPDHLARSASKLAATHVGGPGAETFTPTPPTGIAPPGLPPPVDSRLTTEQELSVIGVNSNRYTWFAILLLVVALILIGVAIVSLWSSSGR